ncbi:MAG: hypothetical protein QME44_10605 [Thermodesulfobacteriota bacterium]|nr:hypothetical protein [Thermodesulfobacteriota bacterium]
MGKNIQVETLGSAVWGDKDQWFKIIDTYLEDLLRLSGGRMDKDEQQ